MGQKTKEIDLLRKLIDLLKLPFFRNEVSHSKNRIKKRPFLLLEVMIGAFLLALVISFSLQSIPTLAKLDQKLMALRSVQREKQNLQSKLSSLFLTIASDRSLSFYTETKENEKTPTLFFLFDHGIDIDPKFSGVIKAKFLIDEEKRCILSYLPIDHDETTLLQKKIVLATEIEGMETLFFKKKEEKGVDDPPFEWVKSWPKENKDLPIMIRIKMKHHQIPLEYAFFPPTSIKRQFEPLLSQKKEM